MADFGKIPKGERFGLIPAFVSRLRDLKPGPKALYASLCTNASAEGRLWRSLDRLAEEFGVSRRQIQRWLNELEAAGLLVRFTVPRKSFLVIRDPAGREWAKRTNLASVIGRRMVFAKPGRAGAVARWSGGTSASKQNDKGVAHSATPMSPIPYLKLGDIADLLVPLPPLAEQRRIVATVDELMALCDRLEAARKARESTCDRLAAASLVRLNAPHPETFHADAHFVLDALPAVTSRADQIKQLRQSVLNLAVRGYLVPQVLKDEPAANFDREIPADLTRPFEIPSTWKWSRFCMLGKLRGGGTPSKSRDDFWNGPIPWVSPKDMKIDYIASAQMSVTDDAIENSAANVIKMGSVLFVVRGMILAHSFPVAVSHAPLAINQDMKALELFDPEMAEFVLRALKGLKPEILQRVQRSSHGTCRLEATDYSDFLMPVPPLAEQHRIVAKVDELMALCDRLEANLTLADEARLRLLDALLHEALEPTNFQRQAA